MKESLKLLARITFLLILIGLAVFNYADDVSLATGIQDPIVERITANVDPANAVLLAAFVLVSFVLILLEEETITLTSFARSLERLSTGKAFTMAERKLEGNDTVKSISETAKSLRGLVPKDSELYTLLNQVSLTAEDLFDGDEDA